MLELFKNLIIVLDKEISSIKMTTNDNRVIFNADYDVDTDYSDLNKFKIMKQGKSVVIIALGDFYQMGEAVHKTLSEKLGYDITLINPRYASGIDEAMLKELLAEHEVIVTLEDGILDGGFGQKIATYYKDNDIKNINFDINIMLEKEEFNNTRLTVDAEIFDT